MTALTIGFNEIHEAPEDNLFRGYFVCGAQPNSVCCEFAKLRSTVKEIKFRVHKLNNHMQLVLSSLEMGQYGKALLACREAVKELEDVSSELDLIRRMPAEHACGNCLYLMAGQGLSKTVG
jgi:hypothetical protein